MIQIFIGLILRTETNKALTLYLTAIYDDFNFYVFQVR